MPKEATSGLLDGIDSGIRFIHAGAIPDPSEDFPGDSVHIGIDPGLSGAMVVFWPNDSIWCYDTEAIDITYRARGKDGEMKDRHRGKFNGAAAAAHIRELTRICESRRYRISAAIELVYARDDEARGSSIVIGKNAGIWIGILVMAGIAYREVPASAWKQTLLSGMPKEKGSSIVGALQMFPASQALLKLKKHHGRADALLIAAYGKRKDTA